MGSRGKGSSRAQQRAEAKLTAAQQRVDFLNAQSGKAATGEQQEPHLTKSERLKKAGNRLGSLGVGTALRLGMAGGVAFAADQVIALNNLTQRRSLSHHVHDMLQNQEISFGLLGLAAAGVSYYISRRRRLARKTDAQTEQTTPESAEPTATEDSAAATQAQPETEAATEQNAAQAEAPALSPDETPTSDLYTLEQLNAALDAGVQPSAGDVYAAYYQQYYQQPGAQ